MVWKVDEQDLPLSYKHPHELLIHNIQHEEEPVMIAGHNNWASNKQPIIAPVNRDMKNVDHIVKEQTEMSIELLH